MGSFGGFGGGGGAPQQQTAAKVDEPKVEEAPIAKTHYDIELVAYDAAQKIKVIKEVRAIFVLGLKEAKDVVESVPCWLKKEVKEEEAKDIEAKLKAVGAELRLV